jgi:putative DNA primase/helicase
VTRSSYSSDAGASLLDAALDYARLGLKVLPLHSTDASSTCSCGKIDCTSPGKHPRTPHGLKDASIDEAAILPWWERFPDANPGIAMGASGLVGIDVDVKNGKQGEETWQAIRDELGAEIEDTTMVRTPSGGFHLWYRTNGSRVGCDVAGRLLGEGIDIKGEGGYLLAPPSRIGGAAYTFVGDHGLERLADLPPALARRLVFTKPSNGKTGTAAPHYEAAIPAGERSASLTSMAGSMRRRGMSQAAISVALQQENATRCRPPLAQAEVERIAASVSSYAPTPSVSFSLTDTGNAELFAAAYGERVRFDHRRGLWFLWGDHHWAEDRDGAIYRMAVQAARDRYLRALAIEDLGKRQEEAKFAIASENRQRLEAQLHLARCQQPIATSGDCWNRDPHLFGVANGVIDLRDASLHDGRPAELITLGCDIRFAPDASCPRWQRFLAEIFLGDVELIDWIWRVVGYLLTGLTSEQCFFLYYGLGANGKSVFLNLLRALLGSYAYNAPFATFEASARSQIPNDLAALVDRRLVTASETAEGVLLNEARMKMLTGGDPVTARFLHREFFTFTPVAKFVLAVNHKPRIRDYSLGIWRRLRLIPFCAQFQGSDDDRDLESKLRTELPGILAWAVSGSLEWQRRGLEPPKAVVTATAGYRNDSDPLSEFLAERCLPDKDAAVRAAAAHEAYKGWADATGLGERERLGRNAFYEALESHFPKQHTNAGNVYGGLRLHDPARPSLDE